MEIYLIKKFNSLHPANNSDLELLSKLKQGEAYKATISKPRNYRFHKKYFALLNLAFGQQDEYDNFEKFRFVMTMKAGHFEAIKTDKGVVYMPRSISFAKMDEVEFERVYQDMLTEVISLIGADQGTIENELINFM